VAGSAACAQSCRRSIVTRKHSCDRDPAAGAEYPPAFTVSIAGISGVPNSSRFVFLAVIQVGCSSDGLEVGAGLSGGAVGTNAGYLPSIAGITRLNAELSFGLEFSVVYFSTAVDIY
jgi:hypothetical protein